MKAEPSLSLTTAAKLSIPKRSTNEIIKQSFSRKGNCMENSIVENFFGIMKKEMFYGYEKHFKTLEELRKAMIKYIHYYNTKRINKKRKGLSHCNIGAILFFNK